MPFLKRSKSHKVAPPKEVEADVPAAETGVEAEPGQVDASKERRRSRFERRTSIFARSKSADAKKSVDRPRTANRTFDHGKELPDLVNETIEFQTAGATFAFPTPSPRLPPTRAATSQVLQSPSPASGSPRIGVAIGSPTQVPAWGRSHTSDHISGRMPKPPMPIKAFPSAVQEESEKEDAPRQELRRKKSGWKTLGNLFRGKSVKSTIPEPFYKVRPEQPESATIQTRTPAQPLGVLETPEASPEMVHSPGSISSHHSRSPSITRGMARFEARAEADRASLMPNIGSKLQHSSSRKNQRQSTAPHQAFKALPPIRDSAAMFSALPTIDRIDSPLSKQDVSVAGAIPRTPRLDLDIPNGEMERYSIMFEKQLAPRQSILERRQSKKLRRLKSDANKDDSPTTAIPDQPALPLKLQPTSRASVIPQRSASSPHLSRVPAVMITVGTEQAPASAEGPITAIHRPRPVRRSKTAPPGSVSPVAPNFSRPKPPTIMSDDSDASPGSPLYGENSLPPTPTTIMTTNTEASSPIASKQHHHHHNQYPDFSLPRVRQSSGEGDEPSWDMLTSSAPAPGSLSSPPASTTSSGGRERYPRVKSPEDLERQIVQVSVARQVSVSRARRQVQKAVATKTQPLRPRVVELSKNRKSTVVLIEGGDE